MWQNDQRQKQGLWNARFDVYEVRGCGHQVLHTCAHPNDDDGGTLVGQVSCSEGHYPPGPQKPW